MRRVLLASEVSRLMHGGYDRPDDSNWPQCQTCHGPVDAIELVDEGKTRGRYWCVILAKCHGAEVATKATFEAPNIRPDDLGIALRSMVLFDPHEHVESHARK